MGFSTGRRQGSIPAWAGEPRVVTASHMLCKVYPRVGGGTRLARLAIHEHKGLSPRGRGNHYQPASDAACFGSIPAWAGEPYDVGSPALTRKVYPRVGGGTVIMQGAPTTSVGLSPRGRGNLHLACHPAAVDGSIPAWAGEPSCSMDSIIGSSVYPRVGGGTYQTATAHRHESGLSPRGRGNPFISVSTASF